MFVNILQFMIKRGKIAYFTSVFTHVMMMEVLTSLTTYWYSGLVTLALHIYKYSGTCAIRHPTNIYGPKLFLLTK